MRSYVVAEITVSFDIRHFYNFKVTIMHNYPNSNIFFFFVLIVFVTASSCKTAAPEAGIPFYLFEGTFSSDKRSFVVMKDSNIVYGTKVDGLYGLLVKDAVKVDGVSIPADQVIGFQSKGIYYKRINNNYAKMLIQGKINVYEKTRVSSNGMTEHVILFQKGNNGTLEEFMSADQLNVLVSDCPKAYEMVNKSEKDLKKALKKDRYHFQNTILNYNGCS
jgi:hypothetical protein